MSAINYYIVGEKLAHRIGERCTDKISTWMKQWSLDNTQDVMCQVNLERNFDDGDADWYCLLDGEQPVIAISFTPKMLEVIRTIIIGKDNANIENTQNSISEQIYTKAIEDLVSSLSGTHKSEKIKISHEVFAELKQRFFDYFKCGWGASVNIGKNVGNIILFPEYLKRVRAENNGKLSVKSELTELNDSIANVSVGLKTILGHTTISIHDLQHLAVGDVIGIDKNIQEPVEVYIQPDSIQLCRAYLGAQDNKLALNLISQN